MQGPQVGRWEQVGQGSLLPSAPHAGTAARTPS